MKKVVIKETQRGLKIRNGCVVDILEPGVHWTLGFMSRTEIHVYDVISPEVFSAWTEALLKNHPHLVQKHFVVAAPSDNQVAVVSKQGNYFTLVPPGSRTLYWKSLEDISVEYLDITAEQEIPSEKFKTMVKRDPNSDQFLFVQVPESHVGIVYIDGRLTKTIEAGSYAYWVGRADIYVQILDLRFQNMEVGGQEILTADRVSLRLNFEAFYRIVDPLKMVREAKSIDEFLYKEFQFALRRYVGQKTLDEILGDKENLSEALTTEVAEKASSVGVELKSAGIKDVILPGGMKEILNQVVAAEKAAQANLIRRREEVAATRSLLNTAKMIDSNPTLMRLKELKTLEKLADKVDSIQVGGGVQGLLEQLRKGG